MRDGYRRICFAIDRFQWLSLPSEGTGEPPPEHIGEPFPEKAEKKCLRKKPPYRRMHFDDLFQTNNDGTFEPKFSVAFDGLELERGIRFSKNASFLTRDKRYVTFEALSHSFFRVSLKREKERERFLLQRIF